VANCLKYSQDNQRLTIREDLSPGDVTALLTVSS